MLGSYATYNILIGIFERSGYQQYSHRIKKLIPEHTTDQAIADNFLDVLFPCSTQIPVFSTPATAIIVPHKQGMAYYSK